MDSRLKTILLSTSALVGFTLAPEIANADLVSDAVGSNNTRFAAPRLL